MVPVTFFPPIQFPGALRCESPLEMFSRGRSRRSPTAPVNAEVLIELPGGQEIVSVVTMSLVKSLGLHEGMNAFAIVKASNVMLGVDEKSRPCRGSAQHVGIVTQVQEPIDKLSGPCVQ